LSTEFGILEGIGTCDGIIEDGDFGRRRCRDDDEIIEVDG